MQILTDEQWNRISDFVGGEPSELTRENLGYCNGWVYDRRFGLFNVPCGYHFQVMGLLLAFHHDCHDADEIAKKLGMKWTPYVAAELQDIFLLTVRGTAFMSNIGPEVVKVGKPSNLNAAERQVFRQMTVTYLDKGDEF